MIQSLSHFFLKKYTKRIEKNISEISEDVLQKFTNYKFPGNVRELENEVERLVTLADDGSAITMDILSPKFLNTNGNTETILQFTELKPAIEHIEKTLINKALKNTRGNILKAADILGISRVGLHKMLKRHAINVALFKTM